MRTADPKLRTLLLAVIAAAGAVALVIAAGAQGPPARAGGDAETVRSGCANEAKPVRRLDPRKVEAALACRVSAEREAKGLPSGRVDELLELAADAHAERMLRQDCFSHRCRGEADLEGRLEKAGYFDGATDWEFAENLGCATTVDAMVRAWLRDRSSRRNLFGPEFDDLGIGFTKRAPSRCDGPRKAGAFTLVLGVTDR